MAELDALAPFAPLHFPPEVAAVRTVERLLHGTPQVVGDREADTGPLATGWHGNKFLNPARDGAVLPVLQRRAPPPRSTCAR